MAKQCIITLLTDFGDADAYVAEMKGVLLTLCPQATLADITHRIPRGDVLAAALTLRRVLPSFPAGTVHAVVVDPGVGTDRRILAARYAGQTVVCPDNGIITLLDRDLPLEQLAAVRDERYFRAGPISTTFHGRDIIAPVAAHLANGLMLGRLGPTPEKIKLLDLPAPAVEADGTIRGQVLHVDHFGNLCSNIPAALLPEEVAGAPPRAPGSGPTAAPRPRLAQGQSPEDLCVFCAGKPVGPIRPTYAAAEPGQPVAVINSEWMLEVAANGGNAAQVLGAGVGTEIRVGLGKKP